MALYGGSSASPYPTTPGFWIHMRRRAYVSKGVRGPVIGGRGQLFLRSLHFSCGFPLHLLYGESRIVLWLGGHRGTT